MEKINLVGKKGYWCVYSDGDPKVFQDEKSALEYCLGLGWVCVDKEEYEDFFMYSLIPE